MFANDLWGEWFDSVFLKDCFIPAGMGTILLPGSSGRLDSS
jgi:hypothetical protein